MQQVNIGNFFYQGEKLGWISYKLIDLFFYWTVYKYSKKRGIDRLDLKIKAHLSIIILKGRRKKSF